MKSKKCNDCGKIINPKTRDAIIQAGYLVGQCRPCKTIESKERQRRKKKLLKGTWFESQY